MMQSATLTPSHLTCFHSKILFLVVVIFEVISSQQSAIIRMGLARSPLLVGIQTSHSKTSGVVLPSVLNNWERSRQI